VPVGAWDTTTSSSRFCYVKLNRFGQIQNLASPKTSILSPSAMDSISAVARPAEVKVHNHKEKGPLKSPQILLIRIDSLWATKLERFVAVQLV